MTVAVTSSVWTTLLITTQPKPSKRLADFRIAFAGWRRPRALWWIPLCWIGFNSNSNKNASIYSTALFTQQSCSKVKGYRSFLQQHQLFPPTTNSFFSTTDEDDTMAPLRASKVSSAAAQDADPANTTPKRKRKTTSPKKTTDTDTKVAAKKKKASQSKQSPTAAAADEAPAKKVAAPKHQVLTERDDIPKLWTEEKAKENGSYTFKIASWNVAGLRALMRNHPDALADLCSEHNLDVLCLQETKLQESHLDDPKLAIRGHLLEEQGYDAHYSCSTAKKGYSGTAVFVRRRDKGGGSRSTATTKAKQTTVTSYFKAPMTAAAKTKDTATAAPTPASSPIPDKELVPVKVSFKMGKDVHDAEGRLVIVDLPGFSFCNLYVPNSGQKLERLSYRTDSWDKDLLAFVQAKQKDRPVMWLGDLNVAHTSLEVWNDGAKHLAKQAGVTAEERTSFQGMLDAGFVDAFRELHPAAKGHYSYWSQRAGNRAPNKGLRLDYFVCDTSFFTESSKVIARDSYVLFDQVGSDHCPVVLELEIKP